MSLLLALLLMTGVTAVGGAASAAAARRPTQRAADLIDRIDDLLPQTQCRRCTFDGCRAYATALARGEADVNQCPPGGERTVAALAALLGRPARPVDPRFGVTPAQPLVAWIDEPACIGCTKCIQACPVDAIVGAPRYMHTVIAAECTGCELCIPSCPVDCIVLRPAPVDGRVQPSRGAPRVSMGAAG
ncbi:MAG TPA: RnfABCDGE type electron transport complex subunit B [Steroidobacter sp.]|jgi:electron transport complex protein RnfB|nr:RnfABCDGE type electron transport complex subunit B [Steroidobacteraceae bacterium]HLS82195.1 RnfABCDGE type electron transport complex subunit B [Steroidobacter sp.]